MVSKQPVQPLNPIVFGRDSDLKKPINPTKKAYFALFPSNRTELIKKRFNKKKKKMREKTYWVAVPAMLGSGVGVDREHMGLFLKNRAENERESSPFFFRSQFDMDFMRSVLSSRTGKLHTPGKWLEVRQILDTLISKKKKKKEKRKTVSSSLFAPL